VHRLNSNADKHLAQSTVLLSGGGMCALLYKSFVGLWDACPTAPGHPS